MVARVKMATPVGLSILSFEDVLELHVSVEQLKVELEGRYIESKDLSKPQIQKGLIKSLSLEAPVVTQQPVVLYCIVFIHLYSASCSAHNQKRFHCERPRKKRAVLR